MAALSRRLAATLIACAAIAAGLVLVACGGGSDDGGDNQVGDVQGINADCGDVQYSGSGTATKLIVSDLPLKGDSAERSKQQNDAIVQEIARKGWQAGNDIQVAFQACDDSIASTGEWDENLCRSNAQKYAANPDVIGVIGTYNSGCAAIEMPVLNGASGGGVPMVSPGNTFVCLTEPSPRLCEPDEPGKYFPSGNRNYIRVVPNDAVQGAGMASFANEQGMRKPFILIASDDPTSEGQGRDLRGRGEVAGDEHRRGRALRPEGEQLYGSDEEGEGRRRGLRLPRRDPGGERGAADRGQGFGARAERRRREAARAGRLRAAEHDRSGGLGLGRDVRQPSGKVPGSLTGEGSVFVNELRSQVGDQPIEVFAPYAGQAAAVLLDAIRVGKTRAGTIDTLFATKVTDGITGNFAITPSGDPQPAPISVQKAAATFELERTIVPPPDLVSAARGG